jgi:hypothetical protein
MHRLGIRCAAWFCILRCLTHNHGQVMRHEVQLENIQAPGKPSKDKVRT